MLFPGLPLEFDVGFDSCFEYYEFPKRNQKEAKGQRKKISSYTLWVPFVSRKVMFGEKSAATQDDFPKRR